MSFRKRLKQSVRDFKGDAKALFKRQDPDKDSTRPTTLSGAQSHTTSPLETSGLVDLTVYTIKFGPLKDLSDMIQGFANMYIMDGSVKKEYDSLQQWLQKLLQLLEEHDDEGIPPTMTSRVQGIRDFIEGELSWMGEGRVTAPPRRLFMAKEQEERFVACCQRIQRYMNDLLVDTSLSMWKIEEQQSKDRVASLVGRLPFSASACYDSSAGAVLKRRECTPGTRTSVLLKLLGWAQNSHAGVYWLNGMAGTGKTTIAYSVCKHLDADTKLGASFFCSRLREDCRNVDTIIPSIACQLAFFSHSYQSALSAVVEKDPNIHTKRVDLQFTALIQEPLLSTKTTLPEGLVVVIDALDECEDKRSTRDILDVLLAAAADIPIRFIVSSRPEAYIRDQMVEERVKSRLVLHELNTGDVQADIDTYLRTELKPMKPPPSDAQIAALVGRAGILFIYAATAVRYIGYDNFQRNSSTRLRTILDRPQGQQTGENKEIDELYRTILEEAFGDDGLEDADRLDMQQVLNTVICAREPLTIDGLSKLLQMDDADRVRAALRPLWSVVHVVTGSELVTTLHASFPDYMFDPSRSKTHHCDSKTQNRELAERCFEGIQQTDPQVNILGLESSYLRDEDVKDIEVRVATGIPPELLYAFLYWADHLKEGARASSVIDKLRDFLSMRLLLWMEVLNLTKRMTVGMECMKRTVSWCQAINEEQELIELAQDAKRFVDAFASNPVSQSTPHIYVSMLAFWPRTSPIAKHYAKLTHGGVEPQGAALDRRQLALLSTWAFEEGTTVKAISPDGSSLALSTGDDVVIIDSSSGGKLLEPLKGHTNPVRSIAFSVNGSRIYTASIGLHDATILVWDTHAGNLVLGPLHLHGHTGDLFCISFSHDGTSIATGGDDQTVRLWDTESGQLMSCLTTGTEASVKEVVFSPDRIRIVARFVNGSVLVGDVRTRDTNLTPLTIDDEAFGVTFSSDGSRIISHSYGQISVWDAQNGESILGPIEGHAADISPLACSPDDRYIVSGSNDRTVRIWDAHNGNLVLGPLGAHTSYITSVAFSPDGSRIISTCGDGLVCTWDAQQHNLPPSSTNATFHPITCVKFSSDGTRFASGSEEGTVSIWDAHTGEMIVGPIEAHTEGINAVDFLNDRVVSGASDGTLSICDALSGEVVLGQLELGTGRIEAIAYSPDSQTIATGSESVYIWNALNGHQVLGPLFGLDGPVAAVKFSPDGTRIVASSWAYGSNIAVWDVSTGQKPFGTLDGHANWVPSVVYSPDGALLASCSHDETITVWDALTGNKQLGPLTGHSALIHSVHFSPNSARLVSDLDRTIQVWDAQTGETMFELLNGHDNGITSVEYSPDGTRILSCSYDMSARIHDARSPAERALSHAESGVGDWRMNKDGWVVDDQSRLLVWVPGDLRRALMWPRTQVIVAPYGLVRLKFDKSRLGELWMEGFTSGM